MKTPMKTISPGPDVQAFRTDILAVLKKHAGDLSADVMLALSAYTTGQLIAMQDQRSMTSDMALRLVSENIELGNEHAIKDALGTPAGNG